MISNKQLPSVPQTLLNYLKEMLQPHAQKQMQKYLNIFMACKKPELLATVH